MCCRENSTLNPLQNAFSFPLHGTFWKVIFFLRWMCSLYFIYRQRAILVTGAWTWDGAALCVTLIPTHGTVSGPVITKLGPIEEGQSSDLFMRNLLI